MTSRVKGTFSEVLLQFYLPEILWHQIRIRPKMCCCVIYQCKLFVLPAQLSVIMCISLKIINMLLLFFIPLVLLDFTYT